MGGGAWPFLVGGVICLVNSVNERDLDLLNSDAILGWAANFLEGLLVSNQSQEGNNRSVVPLDVLGRTRAPGEWSWVLLSYTDDVRECILRRKARVI